jgi:hypothetical protein
MSEIITVGLDPLADRRMRSNRRQAGEDCISGPWGRRRGPRDTAQEAEANAGVGVFRAAAALRCRDGSLWRRSLLGARDRQAWP